MPFVVCKVGFKLNLSFILKCSAQFWELKKVIWKHKKKEKQQKQQSL